MAGPHVDDKKSAVYTARDENLDGASYNIQRIRSRRTSCSELLGCLTELPNGVSILLDRCCSVISDRLSMK